MSEERRQQARLALTMPAEMSTVKDASASGAAFLLKHRVTRGHLLHLEIRGVYVGPDDVPGPNLRFLDGQAPDRLVANR